MKAFVVEKYGSDGLRAADVPEARRRPGQAGDEVLDDALDLAGHVAAG